MGNSRQLINVPTIIISFVQRPLGEQTGSHVVPEES